jgi:hypothetical protein
MRDAHTAHLDAGVLHVHGVWLGGPVVHTNEELGDLLPRRRRHWVVFGVRACVRVCVVLDGRGCVDGVCRCVPVVGAFRSPRKEPLTPAQCAGAQVHPSPPNPPTHTQTVSQLSAEQASRHSLLSLLVRLSSIHLSGPALLLYRSVTFLPHCGGRGVTYLCVCACVMCDV